MHEPRTEDGHQRRSGLGGAAIAAGVIAVIFAVVPVIGEFVAVPAAVLAVTLGWIGFERAGKGLADDGGQALVGGALGLLAGLLVFLVMIATIGPAER